MNLQSIEWLRETMKDLDYFQCRCGKSFDSFILWWNHMVIQKHLVATDEDVQRIKDFVTKLEQ